MLTPEQAKQILDSIALSGRADIEKARTKIVLSGNPEVILISYGGKLKIRPVVEKKMELILQSPFGDMFNPGQIRCCACKSVIRYPAWHYADKRVINEIHYFICVDYKSPKKPTLACYNQMGVE